VRFQAGNPGGPGRPKGSYLNSQAKQWAEKGGIDLLLRIAQGKDNGWSKAHRWDAIKLALAYGIGKPREAVEIFQEDRSEAIDLSWATAEQLERLAGMAYCPADCCKPENSKRPTPHLAVPLRETK
jgi:hypothetical protein